MARTTRIRFIRTLAAATVAATAVTVAAGVASAGHKPRGTYFTMTPLAKFVPCMAADGVTPPRIDVSVERGRENDTMVVRGRDFRPGVQFDLFTIEHSRLDGTGGADPAFAGFGMSWYQSDLEANDHGRIDARVRTVLLDQIFGLVDGGATPVPPTNTFNAGFWFNDPADAAPCGFTGATPFNGEHAAGPLAFVTVPDATTGLGPLCTSPEQAADGTWRCNP